MLGGDRTIYAAVQPDSHNEQVPPAAINQPHLAGAWCGASTASRRVDDQHDSAGDEEQYGQAERQHGDGIEECVHLPVPVRRRIADSDTDDDHYRDGQQKAENAQAEKDHPGDEPAPFTHRRWRLEVRCHGCQVRDSGRVKKDLAYSTRCRL